MKFIWNEFHWVADLKLPAWSDFTLGNTTPLIFAPEGRDETAMTTEETALARWVPDNHMLQKPVLLAAVLKAYPEFRREFFEDHAMEEDSDILPKISDPEELSSVIELEELFVHQIANDGIPYVGYQFSCKWDREGGLGVLMHSSRIARMGDANTAFTLWMAERDLNGSC